MTAQGTNMSFWEHLDVLRASLVRIVAVTVLCGIAAFLFKEEVFTAVLAPKDEGFVTYRILERLAGYAAGTDTPAFSVRLINTGLAEQFVIHMKVSVYIGVLLASPYILYLLFRFISPALYANERKYASRIVGWGYVMFLSGVSVCYFLIFPLTFRFLGTYQVSDEVENMISLQSYIGTLGRHDDDARYRVRDTRGMLAACPVGNPFGRFYAALPPTCGCGYSGDCSHHHAHVRHIYVIAGSLAHVAALRGKHLGRETNTPKNRR